MKKIGLPSAASGILVVSVGSNASAAPRSDSVGTAGTPIGDFVLDAIFIAPLLPPVILGIFRSLKRLMKLLHRFRGSAIKPSAGQIKEVPISYGFLCTLRKQKGY